MKRILNYLLIVLVLLSMTACKMEIAQKDSIDNNAVSFSLRAGEDVIGTKMTIEVIKDDGSLENNTLFVGPRKFIAIKPKKLVIADVGATYVSPSGKDTNPTLRKRVVTVNIDDYTSTAVRLDNTTMFAGSIGSGGYALN